MRGLWILTRLGQIFETRETEAGVTRDRSAFGACPSSLQNRRLSGGSQLGLRGRQLARNH